MLFTTLDYFEANEGRNVEALYTNGTKYDDDWVLTVQVHDFTNFVPTQNLLLHHFRQLDRQSRLLLIKSNKWSPESIFAQDGEQLHCIHAEI